MKNIIYIYKEKKVPITKVLAWFCKHNDIYDLLDLKDMEDIINEYKINVKKNLLIIIRILLVI